MWYRPPLIKCQYVGMDTSEVTNSNFLPIRLLRIMMIIRSNLTGRKFELVTSLVSITTYWHLIKGGRYHKNFGPPINLIPDHKFQEKLVWVFLSAAFCPMSRRISSSVRALSHSVFGHVMWTLPSPLVPRLDNLRHAICADAYFEQQFAHGHYRH